MAVPLASRFASDRVCQSTSMRWRQASARPMRSSRGPLFRFDKLPAAIGYSFAGLHLVKINPHLFEFGGKAVGRLDDAGESAEVLRNGQFRAHGLGGLRGHPRLHPEMPADVEQGHIDRITLADCLQ